MNSDDHAIVVGINDYRFFEPLAGAENDALKFAGWLMGGGQVPVANVHLILSSDVQVTGDEPYPVKHIVDRALLTLVPGQGGRKGRRLYFYFAGHGCAPGIQDIALLMADAASDTLGLSLAADSYRASLRAKAPFDELVFVLDCCRNVIDGAIPGVSPFSGFKASARADQVRHLVCLGTGFGKEAWQTTSRNPDDSRGLFTRALIDGLNGEAADKTGIVTAASLEDYVKPMVRAEAERSGLSQIPEFDGSYGGMVFATGLAPRAVRVSIEVPAEWIGPIVLKDGQLMPIIGPRPLATSLEATLARGIYCLEDLGTGRRKLFSVEGGGVEVYHV